MFDVSQGRDNMTFSEQGSQRVRQRAGSLIPLSWRVCLISGVYLGGSDNITLASLPEKMQKKQKQLGTELERVKCLVTGRISCQIADQRQLVRLFACGVLSLSLLVTVSADGGRAHLSLSRNDAVGQVLRVMLDEDQDSKASTEKTRSMPV